MKKIYIVKKLAPWMVDEILEFSKHTQFEVLFLKKQTDFHKDNIEKLKGKGLTITNVEYKFKFITLKKVWVLLKFVITNISSFLKNKYSTIVALNSALWFLFLDKKMLNNKNCSIHAQFATQASVVAYLIKMHNGKETNYSFTVHAYDIFFNNAWFELLSKNCYKFYSISEFNISYIKKKYPNADFSKLELMRLGTKRVENYYKTDNNVFTLGLLSWFQEKKGIHFLLDAIKAIRAENINIKLILAGDGPLKGKILDTINEYQIADIIEYRGSVKAEQKELFFENIDVFILPAISVPNDMDGIPVVLMEAIARGIPIISTSLSGIPEICVNNVNGLLIEEKSIEAIKTAINYFVEHPESISDFKKGALDVFQNYDIEKNSYNKIKNLDWI